MFISDEKEVIMEKLKTFKTGLLTIICVTLLLYLPSSIAQTDMFNAASRTAWFQSNYNTKRNAAAVYVILEPNCWYCMLFYRDLLPLLHQGRLKIRWILVSFLDDSSRGKVAAILNSKNPNEALYNNEMRYNKASGVGGIKPIAPSQKILKKITKNNNFIQDYSLSATPILLYRDKSGQANQVVGLQSESDIASLLSKMDTRFEPKKSK